MSAWASGSIVGEYRLVEPLGAGGMGEVWRVVHLPTGAQRALKANLAVDAESIERFKREARALAGLEHPNVGRVHTAGEHAGRLYLVMDLAPGGDLATRLKSGPLAPEAARTLARDLGLGLAHVHSRGLLHRDLKPANVLFDDEGRPLLVDFGLARRVDGSSLTQSGAIVGTPSHMAPEQANPVGGVDERTDVYGLGAVLYHALTGQPPFPGASLVAVLRAVMLTPPTPPWELNPSVPRDLSAVCLKALAKEPGARYPSARAFVKALEEPAPGVASSRRWAVVAGLGAVAALAVGYAAVSRAGPSSHGPEVAATSGAAGDPAEVAPTERGSGPAGELAGDPTASGARSLDLKLGELPPPKPEDFVGCEDGIVRVAGESLLAGKSGGGLGSASKWLWGQGRRQRCLALLYYVATSNPDHESQKAWIELAHYLDQPRGHSAGSWTEEEWEREGGEVLVECFERAAEVLAPARLKLGELYRLGRPELGIEPSSTDALRWYRAAEDAAVCPPEDRLAGQLGVVQVAWKFSGALGPSSDEQALQILAGMKSEVTPESHKGQEAQRLERNLTARIARTFEAPLDRALSKLEPPRIEDFAGCERANVSMFAEDLIAGRSGVALESAFEWLWRRGDRRVALALLYRVASARGDGLSARGWGMLATKLLDPGVHTSAGWSTPEWEQEGADVILECYRRGLEAGCANALLGLGRLLLKGSETPGVEANLPQALTCFRAVESAKQLDNVQYREAQLKLAEIAWEHPTLPGRPNDAEALYSAREAMRKYREGSRDYRRAQFVAKRLEGRMASAGDQE